MADWFAGKGGSDANSGATWPLRKLTITALVGVAWAAGDWLIVGPGTYRENVLVSGGGGSAVTSAGTASVTNESQVVTFAGVNIVAAGVLAGDQLLIGNFASGVDGQTYAAGPNQDQFTSAAGNFQAGMVGYMIEILSVGAYLIGAVGGAGTITLVDQNNIGWPGAGGPGLTYYVVSGEGPYEIESVDSSTQLTLCKPWSGPTLTGLAHEIYRPIYLIADTTGELTDSVGGVVRITGSDDDETRTRVYGIQLWDWSSAIAYWHIRGFRIDMVTSCAIELDGADYIVLEDLSVIDYAVECFVIFESSPVTVRRCCLMGGGVGGNLCISIITNPGNEIDNSYTVLENLYIHSALPIYLSDYGGVTIKNVVLGFNSYSGFTIWGLPNNTATFVHDCKLHFCGVFGAALDAGALGMIVEAHNNLWSNEIDRTNVNNTEGNSTAYPHLPMLPLLTGRARNPMTWFAPSEWDPTRYASGLYSKNEDMFGIHNRVAQTRRSWGAIHCYDTLRDESHMYGAFIGSLYMENAAQQQFCYNVREDWDYDVTVRVYIEPNYAGDNPELIVQQPGQATVVVASTGAKGSWEQISASFTTGPDLDQLRVSIRSNNTAAAANCGVSWQDLLVN